MEQYKDSSGRVDLGFFYDIWKEDGRKPQALIDQPTLPNELVMVIDAHNELSSGELISYADITAYLSLYPEIEPTRFASLLRAYDRALLSK